MNELKIAILILSSVGIINGIFLGCKIGKSEAKYMRVKWVLKDINPFYPIDPAYQRTTFERVLRNFLMTGSITSIISMVVTGITLSRISKICGIQIQSELLVWLPTIIYLIILLLISLVSYSFLYPRMEALAQKIRELNVTNTDLENINNWQTNNDEKSWKKWYFSFQSIILDNYGINLL